MDADRYLQRIGLTEAPRPTLEGLDLLIAAHQRHVPFENLSTYRNGSEISIEADHLYRKVVEDNRGGYCYELNGAFCDLLNALGFEAWNVFACVVVAGREPSICHRGTLVRICGALHFADVGKGDLRPGFSVPLNGETRTIGAESHRILPDESSDEWVWLMSSVAGGEEKASLKISLTPRAIRDFLPYNRMACCEQASVFVKNRMATLRTSEGFLSLRGDHYEEIAGSQVVESKDIAEEDIPALLKEKFGVII